MSYVRLGMRIYLFARERRTRAVTPRGIADERREVPDDQHHCMTEVLELSQLSQRHRVTEVEIGRGGIYAELDAQRTVLAQLLEKVGLRNEVGNSALDDVHLLGRRAHSCSPCGLP